MSDEGEAEEVIERSPEGRYVRYAQKVGTGSFKTVWKGQDMDTAREVAWNTINIAHYKAALRKRIMEEVMLLRRLSHPCLLQFYGSWLLQESMQVVFVTELFHAGTLKEFTRKYPISMAQVKKYCRSILECLVYLHTQDPPVIHRDLKCDNIFIDGADGNIKIGDLGLSTQLLPNSEKAYTVLGTPEFMAPEMYEAEYTETVDIYAFGMCVLEMITKKAPYEECASNVAAVMKKVTSGQLPEGLATLQEKWPDAYEFVHRCIVAQGDESRPCAAALLEDPFLQIDKDDKYRATASVPAPPSEDESKGTGGAPSAPADDAGGAGSRAKSASATPGDGVGGSRRDGGATASAAANGDCNLADGTSDPSSRGPRPPASTGGSGIPSDGGSRGGSVGGSYGVDSARAAGSGTAIVARQDDGTLVIAAVDRSAAGGEDVSVVLTEFKPPSRSAEADAVAPAIANTKVESGGASAVRHRAASATGDATTKAAPVTASRRSPCGEPLRGVEVSECDTPCASPPATPRAQASVAGRSDNLVVPDCRAAPSSQPAAPPSPVPHALSRADAGWGAAAGGDTDATSAPERGAGGSARGAVPSATTQVQDRSLPPAHPAAAMRPTSHSAATPSAQSRVAPASMHVEGASTPEAREVLATPGATHGSLRGTRALAQATSLAPPTAASGLAGGSAGATGPGASRRFDSAQAEGAVSGACGPAGAVPPLAASGAPQLASRAAVSSGIGSVSDTLTAIWAELRRFNDLDAQLRALHAQQAAMMERQERMEAVLQHMAKAFSARGPTIPRTAHTRARSEPFPFPGRAPLPAPAVEANAGCSSRDSSPRSHQHHTPEHGAMSVGSGHAGGDSHHRSVPVVAVPQPRTSAGRLAGDATHAQVGGDTPSLPPDPNGPLDANTSASVDPDASDEELGASSACVGVVLGDEGASIALREHGGNEEGRDNVSEANFLNDLSGLSEAPRLELQDGALRSRGSS